jgi:tagaturonate reductase
MNDLPETVLQFGAGKFLRAFADLFIHQTNQASRPVGRVVVVQSTGAERARLLNRQLGRYHVLVRGLAGGETIDRIEESASISRALVAATEWEQVCKVARSPQLRTVISNTAEAGYDLDPEDRPDRSPPGSFPAKLLLLLHERFKTGQPGVLIVPCELHERNADLLQRLVIGLTDSWKLGPELVCWVREECRWLNTLVDRIVTGPPKDHPVSRDDPLVCVAEPFAFWAVEEKPGTEDFLRHPAVRRAADVQPFFLRKVRILNAAHTAMVHKAREHGIALVREAVAHPEMRAWLDRLLFEEIVPTLEGRVEAPEQFARQTIERFQNPFMEHRFTDIAVYHDAKVKIRLVPTRAEFLEKFGRVPPLLDEAIRAQ